jgi:hypothetical protein
MPPSSPQQQSQDRADATAQALNQIHLGADYREVRDSLARQFPDLTPQVIGQAIARASAGIRSGAAYRSVGPQAKPDPSRIATSPYAGGGWEWTVAVGYQTVSNSDPRYVTVVVQSSAQLTREEVQQEAVSIAAEEIDSRSDPNSVSDRNEEAEMTAWIISAYRTA